VKTEGVSGVVAAALGVWSPEPGANHHSDFGYLGGDTEWTRITGTWRSRPDERVIQVALFGDPDFSGRAFFDDLLLEEVGRPLRVDAHDRVTGPEASGRLHVTHDGDRRDEELLSNGAE
jgi:hypothetical protein